MNKLKVGDLVSVIEHETWSFENKESIYTTNEIGMIINVYISKGTSQSSDLIIFFNDKPRLRLLVASKYLKNLEK